MPKNIREGEESLWRKKEIALRILLAMPRVQSFGSELLKKDSGGKGRATKRMNPYNFSNQGELRSEGDLQRYREGLIEKVKKEGISKGLRGKNQGFDLQTLRLMARGRIEGVPERVRSVTREPRGGHPGRRFRGGRKKIIGVEREKKGKRKIPGRRKKLRPPLRKRKIQGKKSGRQSVREESEREKMERAVIISATSLGGGNRS